MQLQNANIVTMLPKCISITTMSSCYCFSVQYMVQCVRLEVLAQASVIRLLTRRVFQGWTRLTREGRVRGWEMDRQARKMHER